MRASVPLISKCLNSSLSRVSERVLDPASPKIEAVLRDDIQEAKIESLICAVDYGLASDNRTTI
jgi:hypothetical protein